MRRTQNHMSKQTPHTHAPARCSARRHPRRCAAALFGPSMDSIATARVASATVRPSAARANPRPRGKLDGTLNHRCRRCFRCSASPSHCAHPRLVQRTSSRRQGCPHPARQMPLWLSFTPGAIFGVSRRALLGRASALIQRIDAALASGSLVGLCDSSDPIAGHVLERLWMYMFLEEDEVDDAIRRFSRMV